MPEKTKHAPGTFCWAELSARNAAEAKKFYKGIFAWELDDMPIGDGSVYTMLRVRDKHVAALYEQPKEEVQRGVPPHWTVYIAVESADEVAGRVVAAGGKVHAPPFDVLDVGRMAVIQDSTGGIFAIWQPRKHQGAGLVGETNSVVWNELTSTDPKVAAAFYTKLFGWKATTSSDLGVEYTQFALNGEPVAGLLKTPMPGMPTYWTPYFAVDDADALAKTVKTTGGQALVEPTDIPTVGRFAIFKDPQDAIFGILRPLPR